MNGRFVVLTALKDLRRRLADPVALIMWFGLPLVIGTMIMALSTGGDGAGPRGRLLVADEDDSFVSGLLAGAAGQGPLGELFEVTQVDPDEGRRVVDDGDASALLILPAGLQDAVLGEGTAEIELVTNPAQRILPGMLEEAIEIVVEAAFYGERVLGEPARRIADGPPLDSDFFSNETIVEITTAINTRLRELGDTLSPPVLTVEHIAPADDADGTSAPGFGDLGLVLLPGVIFMSVLFIGQGLSSDVWEEKRFGTLRRAVFAPPATAAFLAGKLLAGAGLVGVAALVGVAVGAVFFDLPLPYAPLAMLWTTFGGVVLLVYFVLLQLVASSPRAGNVLTTLVLFPAMMLGGSFFPFEAMPAWMAALGRWTPNGIAVVRLKEIVAAAPDAAGLLTAALAIGLPALAACAVSVRLLRGPFLMR